MITERFQITFKLRDSDELWHAALCLAFAVALLILLPALFLLVFSIAYICIAAFALLAIGVLAEYGARQLGHQFREWFTT